MNWSAMASHRILTASGSLLLCATFAWSVHAQAPAAAEEAGLKAARQAIETRQAVYKLIGNNFRVLGDVAKGSTKYDAADLKKRIALVVFLSDMLDDAFPDISNLGEPETKTKPDAWTNRADFEKRLKDLHEHAVVLAQLDARELGPTEAFKANVTALAQDCKGCHDTYRAK
jgi:cytochrome c556